MKKKQQSGMPSDSAGKICILVLGMHRSGTSALTRILNLLGCALPSDLWPADYGNPEGYWEGVRTIEINEALLRSLGRRWDDIRELPVDWLRRPEADLARQQIQAFIDREFSMERLWVLKDPRLCRLAPLWIEVIERAGIDVRVIVPVRHPAEVAYSLARRDGIAVGRSHLLWMQHLLGTEAATRGNRRVITHFHELLLDWRKQVETISTALGITWPGTVEEAAGSIEVFLRPSLPHANARSSDDLRTRMQLPGLITTLYGEITSADSVDAAWEAITRIAGKVEEAASLYSPGIAELAQQLERTEREQTSDRIADGVGQEGLEPLIRDLTREILAQRDEVIPALDSQGKALVGLVERIRSSEVHARDLLPKAEQLESLIQALGQEIARQRAEVIPALESQGKAILQLVGRIETDIEQNNLQNIELLQLHAETQHLLERTEGLTPLLEAVSGGIASQRAEVMPALDSHSRSLRELSQQLDSHSAGVVPVLQRQEARLASLAVTIQSQMVQREEHIGELERTVSELRASIDELDRQLHRSESERREFELENASRGKRIYELEHETARQQSLVAGLLEDIGLRDGLAADLRKATAAIGLHVEELTHQLAHRDRVLAEQEARITGLSSDLFEKETQINSVLTSHSWRITQPLRMAVAALRGTGHLKAGDQQRGTGFDASWYLSRYPDVATSGIDPYGHFISAGRAEGRQPLPPVIQGQPNRWMERFSKARSLKRGRAGSILLDAPADSANDGGGEGEFDRDFYLMQYPDIAKAGMDPYQHFVQHGRAEGRQGAKPKLVVMAGGVDFDPSRETVLVVSHEASRTGAPVLSLNIAQSLQLRYNVITFLLGGGPLVDAFRVESALLAGPMDLRGSTLRATLVIEQLLALHDVKFAIVNSIESRVTLEPLARNGVPAVSLVHEFAAYTRPKHAFRDAVFWAGETVFSTTITHENAVQEFPELAGRPSNIIPQGRCNLGGEELEDFVRDREETRLLKVMRPQGSKDDSIVILGAGYVQQRKGVDLFLMCAAEVLKSDIGPRCRFVWIGKGYEPDKDMAYSVYLADQLRRSGLDRVVRIIDETSSIETAYQAADMLLISSRLDPLPNVAIEAMAHGVPVLCFDRTTGIAPVLEQEGLSDLLVSPYLDTSDMAKKVVKLAGSEKLRSEIAARVRKLVGERFDMTVYVDRIEQLALSSGASTRASGADAREIIEEGVVRGDYFLQEHQRGLQLDEVVEFEYLRSWAKGIARRKLFPGFHPGVYAERLPATRGDPLLAWLRAGRPKGPWCSEIISPGESSLPVTADVRIALHLHVYFPDLLPDILERLRGNQIRPDLLVSVPTSAAAEAVRRELTRYEGNVIEVKVVPNRGRDIGPLITAFGSTLLERYDLVGHLHTKKSLDLGDPAFGERWSRFLLDNLLGADKAMADRILGRMAADPKIGMVFPDDPYVVGWADNLPFARELADRLGVSELPEEFSFPIGTMFWARCEAIRPLLELGLDWDDYPPEPLLYDGSILHALERLFPLVAATRGGRSVLTNVPGVSR